MNDCNCNWLRNCDVVSFLFIYLFTQHALLNIRGIKCMLVQLMTTQIASNHELEYFTGSPLYNTRVNISTEWSHVLQTSHKIFLYISSRLSYLLLKASLESSVHHRLWLHRLE